MLLMKFSVRPDLGLIKWMRLIRIILWLIATKCEEEEKVRYIFFQSSISQTFFAKKILSVAATTKNVVNENSLKRPFKNLLRNKDIKKLAFSSPSWSAKGRTSIVLRPLSLRQLKGDYHHFKQRDVFIFLFYT